MFLGLTNADTSFHAKKVSALEKKQVGYFFASLLHLPSAVPVLHSFKPFLFPAVQRSGTILKNII